ncbi:MAG TPA: fluoride efflux transporter CrcB [Acidiferrobacteraceae bacterium]|nr:fluoride efflux transporter CrcB [Acidiferrobacteraceae bacterium]
MSQLLFIATGGALGALLRFWVSTSVYSLLGRGFPFGTLMVNTVGSLFMGFLFVFLVERSLIALEWRSGALIGLLGAFTTFSTFSMETLSLIEDGALLKAGLNIFLSVSLCLLATWLGVQMGRQL